MGLFTKQPKITKETVTATCPVCGKQHAAIVHKCEAYFLDGTPQLTLDELLSGYVECDCGLVFSVTAPRAINPACAQSYNEARAKEYPDVQSRTLALIQAQCLHSQTNWMYARYYQENHQQDKLQAYLEERLSGLTRYGIEMGSGSLPQIKLASKFIFNERYERIDLLRRLGRFEEAMECIKTLREAKYYETPHELFDFLKLEEKLINQKNTAQY